MKLSLVKKSVTVRHPPDYRCGYGSSAPPFLVAKLVTTGALVTANALGRNAIPSKWRSERITRHSEKAAAERPKGDRE